MKGVALQTTIALLLFMLIMLIVAGLYQSPAARLMVNNSATQTVILQNGTTIDATPPTPTQINQAGQTVEATINSAGAASTQATTGVIKHTVQTGEGLWRIAQSYNTTVDAILALNPQITDPDLIKPGQELVIARP